MSYLDPDLDLDQAFRCHTRLISFSQKIEGDELQVLLYREHTNDV